MKLIHLFVLFSGLAFGFASAQEEAAFNYTGTVWAAGAENGGWYDANKNTVENDKDDNLCYAATAANLIAWWQNEYGMESEKAPKGINEIWGKYVDSCVNPQYGGYTAAALNWWISGVYKPESAADQSRFFTDEDAEGLPPTLKNFEGYYFDEYSLTQQQLGKFITDLWDGDETDDMTVSELSVAFADILKGGCGIALGLRSDDPDNELAHAITLWGAEYQDGNLVKLWLTDSDDSAFKPRGGDMTKEGDTLSRLFAVNVVVDNEAGKIRFVHDADPDDLYVYHVLGEGVYINSVYVLDPSALVPEPTTATLSLLALAALAARRRRR